MIVCVCHAVPDREIRQVVALGARDFDAVQSQLGVGTCCGRCVDCARAIVEQAIAHASCAAPVGAD